MNREDWLSSFSKGAAIEFLNQGYEVPENVRIAVGFPSTGRRSKRIGECWTDKASKDGTFEIFITPTIDDSHRVAGITTHELVHAVVGLDKKHGKVFKACATAMGLEGKMTATTEGEKWHEWADKILARIGPIPHALLDAMTNSRPKSESENRHIKCECDCGVIFRMSRKVIEEIGDNISCPDSGCEGRIEVNL